MGGASPWSVQPSLIAAASTSQSRRPTDRWPAVMAPMSAALKSPPRAKAASHRSVFVQPATRRPAARSAARSPLMVGPVEIAEIAEADGIARAAGGILDDAPGDVPQLDVLPLRGPDQQLERLVGTAPLRPHEDALGLLDRRPADHRLAETGAHPLRVPVGLGVGQHDRRLRGEGQ